MNAADQIVGRERNQRALYRQLVRCAVVSRRVNSKVSQEPREIRFPLQSAQRKHFKLPNHWTAGN